MMVQIFQDLPHSRGVLFSISRNWGDNFEDFPDFWRGPFQDSLEYLKHKILQT